MKMSRQLKIRFSDVVLEDHMADQLPRERLGCFVQYDNQFVDVLMIKAGAHMIKSDELTLTLVDSKETSDPSLVFLVKDIQKDEPYVGSVSIFRSVLLEGELNKKYSMWITLFDDQGDDEYDGQMGMNDDEEPRIQVELTVVDPAAAPAPSSHLAAEEKPQIAAALQQPDVSPKKDKKVKSYMNPIHNLKNKQGGAAPTQTTQPAARRAPSPLKNSASGKAITKPEPAQAARPKINKPQVPSSMKKQVQVQDIQHILDQNPSKRQNVAFLKKVLDDQLNKLCTNLKVMQSDNSEIETETIQRLQLIEKFGNDASAGLQLASQQNQKLKQDLADQVNQHQEVIKEQNQ